MNGPVAINPPAFSGGNIFHSDSFSSGTIFFKIMVRTLYGGLNLSNLREGWARRHPALSGLDSEVRGQVSVSW